MYMVFYALKAHFEEIWNQILKKQSAMTIPQYHSFVDAFYYI
jgi:hypothetical protein